jgi:DNA-binding transcriptional LysR family regulator
VPGGFPPPGALGPIGHEGDPDRGTSGYCTARSQWLSGEGRLSAFLRASLYFNGLDQTRLGISPFRALRKTRLKVLRNKRESPEDVGFQSAIVSAREGIDCVARVGDLHDSDMIARRVGMLAEVTCAAPAYIERFGMPANLDALAGHRMVGFHSSATRTLLPLEFTIDGVVRNVNLPAPVAVNAAESLVAAGRLGLGLIQVPRYHIESDLERGTLVPVLPDFPPTPTPVSLLYPPNRQLSPRVRVFTDWLVHAFDASRG